MKAIHVLGRIDGFQDALRVYLRRKRKLNKDSIHVVVAVQVFDNREHFQSRHRCWRREECARQAELLASRDFAFHVQLRRGIVADKDSR